MAIVDADEKGLRTAVEAIKRGHIVAYPTETFYGLGVDPYNEDALKDLSELKGWKEIRPVSILIDSIVRLDAVARDVTPIARVLIDGFWPGSLTLIFKAHPSLPFILSGNTGKIGVRLSSNPIAIELLNSINAPLTTTSANPAGEKSTVTAEEVAGYFGQKVPIVLQGGGLKGVRGSTILDLTGDEIAVIREGDIPIENIWRCLQDSYSSPSPII
ncbi:MAG: L-threonylcarbamoyladenylate synthase [Thermodesulfobacteriota bacterium]